MYSTKKLIATGMVAVIGVGSALGCQPMEVDYQYCDDIETVRSSLNDVTVTRTGIVAELNDDLDEMGAERRCPGYSVGQQDQDG